MHQRTVSNKDSWNASDGLAGWGMAIFMISSVGCGFANSFWTLLVCRIIMGAGEASIINLTGKLHQSIHEWIVVQLSLGSWLADYMLD